MTIPECWDFFRHEHTVSTRLFHPNVGQACLVLLVLVKHFILCEILVLVQTSNFSKISAVQLLG